MTTSQDSPPLSGIRVLDFSELLPGPFLTQSLAELGADVIKIERPNGGDRLRLASPALFEAVNRGKQYREVDLRDKRQREGLYQLLQDTDILVEAYRPGVLTRHGLGYDALKQTYPRLIYLSLTGYGQDGPYAALPGHDINYLAASGALSLSGSPDSEPQSGAGVPMADLCGATYGLAAIFAALYQRERTGLGQFLDVALTDTVAHWVNARVAPMRLAGLTDRAARRQSLLRPAYGVFPCKDGKLVSVAALENHFWKRLIAHLDMRPYDEARYVDPAERRRAARQINQRMAQAMAQVNSKDFIERMQAADVPVMLMMEPAEVAESVHFRERGLTVETAVGPLSRFPVRLRGMSGV